MDYIWPDPDDWAVFSVHLLYNPDVLTPSKHVMIGIVPSS